jgi:hypothetical protein
MLGKGSEVDAQNVGMVDALAALHIAESMELVYMICKCKIFVGICLKRIRRWNDALVAFG